MKKFLELYEKHFGSINETTSNRYFSGQHDVIYFSLPDKEDSSKELLKDIEEFNKLTELPCLLYDDDTISWFTFT